VGERGLRKGVPEIPEFPEVPEISEGVLKELGVRS
jgi:hypothetical protein